MAPRKLPLAVDNNKTELARHTQGFCPQRLAHIPEFFDSYLTQQKFSGYSLLIARHDTPVLELQRGRSGFAQDEGFAIAPDTIFRIYSMTKPITSVAMMMLYEQGAIALTDPITKFLPVFENVRVFVDGTPQKYSVRKPERMITLHDLLTHQSGLTYDIMADHPVDALYRNMGLITLGKNPRPLAEFCDLLAKQPLVFSPGTAWNYSVATDVCGYIIELVSGQTLDKFFAEHIFRPLNMVDTSFTIADTKRKRLANNYNRNPLTKEIKLVDSPSRTRFTQRVFFSGGGGLLSTMADYFRFCRMLRNGGSLDGQRLLSRKTIDLMTCNHLPNKASLRDHGRGSFAETAYDGVGFGLGFSIALDPHRTKATGSRGIYAWGGMASTYFWIDPVEDIITIFLTQLMPSDSYPIRPQLQQLVYAALT